jgi:hypothetical protein
LTGRFGGGYVDAALSQPAEVLRAMLRIDDVKCAVAVLETFADIREEDLILLISGVEEGTDMSRAVQG